MRVVARHERHHYRRLSDITAGDTHSASIYSPGRTYLKRLLIGRAHPMKIKLTHNDTKFTLLSLTVAKVKKNGHLAEDRQGRNREKAKIYRYQ